MNANLLLQILIGAIPEIPQLVIDFRNLLVKHPGISASDLAAAIGQVSTTTDAAADAILTKAAADVAKP